MHVDGNGSEIIDSNECVKLLSTLFTLSTLTTIFTQSKDIYTIIYTHLVRCKRVLVRSNHAICFIQ